VANANAPARLNGAATFQSAPVQLRQGRDAGLISRDVALPGGHRLELVGVSAFRVLREIGAHRLAPGFGLLGAEMVDDRAHQGQVVDVRRGAHAHASLPLGIGKLLVGLELAGLDLGFVVRDDAGAHGEAEPLAARFAKAFRNARLEQRRAHRLE